jgi:hypothetical protein
VKEHAAVLHFQIVGALEVCSSDGLFSVFKMGDVDVGEEFQLALGRFGEFLFQFAMLFGDGLHLLLDLPTAVLLDLDLIVDLLVLMLQHRHLLQQSPFLVLSCFLLLCNGGLDGCDLALSHRSGLFEFL